MLILIIGRWMLPKGDMKRDQLAQLLLVYIGTAADIIEFFDSFKDEKVNTNKFLCITVLCIWSWSLLQFTVLLTSSKNPPKRIQNPTRLQRAKEICCSIDVWEVLINIILQDAPFFVFRLLLITYYKLISYMNIFFTCKNTLVITLQVKIPSISPPKMPRLVKLSGNAALFSNRFSFTVCWWFSWKSEKH